MAGNASGRSQLFPGSDVGSVSFDPEGQPRLLARAWAGPRALNGLEPLLARAVPRFELDASALKRADAYTGAVVREALDRHLAADPGHRVVLREPAANEPHAMLCDLLNVLPPRAQWAGERPSARGDSAVLLPAHRVEDRETVELSNYALGLAVAQQRLPVPEARLLLHAAKQCSFNDLIHRRNGVMPGLQCVCHTRQSHDVQVVTLSTSAPTLCHDDPERYAKILVGACRDPFTGLGGLCWQGRGPRVDGTLRIRCGPIRLFARHGKVITRLEAEDVPWFAAGYEIHLPG